MKKHHKILIQKVSTLVFCMMVLIVLLIVVANNQTVVNFPDRGLELAIREKINKPNGSILLSEVRKISRLDASTWSIERLDGLENLSRLEALNLESNRVKDLTPLRELKRLTYLNLRNNGILHLDSINFNILEELPIRRLSLQHNMLEKDDSCQHRLSDIHSISKLQGLEILELRDNEISDLSPLIYLSRLEKLDLRDNQIENIEPLSDLINLKELNLRNNKIIELSSLSNLTNLTYLNIHSNNNIKSLEPLQKLTRLQTLIIRNVPAGNSIRYIKDMNNLKRLNIANCEITDISVLAALFSQGAFRNNSDEEEPDINMVDNLITWNSMDSLLSVLNYRGDIDYRYPLWMPELYKLDPVNFSHSGGFYLNEIDLTLSHSDPDVTIIYTLDGSEPELKQVNSRNAYRRTYLYNGPIKIKSREGEPNLFSEIKTTGIVPQFLSKWNQPSSEVYKATVIRAKAFKSGRITSGIKTATFFVDDNIENRYTSVPVISLAGDYQDLFDSRTGIYVPGIKIRGSKSNQNFYKGWKKKAHLEFYDVYRQKGFSNEYVIRIQGRTSIAAPQKGLHVISNSDIIDNFTNYPIFNNTNFRASEINHYKRFIIRAWGSAQDWPVFFNDAYNQKLVSSTDLDIQAYKPAILFINGEYWGLHELREANKNSWYYRFHYGIDQSTPGLDIINEWNLVNEGTIDEWNNLWAFIRTNDMSDDLNFEHVSQMVDIDNFIKYIIHCTYLGKRDWPEQNEAKWRPRESGGKWRFIQFDMDQGLNDWSQPKFDMIKHVVMGDTKFPHHKLFGKFLGNRKFRNQFLSTYADWMNTILSTQSELTLFNEMADELQPYLQEFEDRWPATYHWESGLETGRNLISERRKFRIQQLKSFFELSELLIKLDVNNKMGGYIKINSVEITDGTPGVTNNPYPWEGTYFTNIPVKLVAIPNDGFQFTGWRFSGTEKDIMEFISNDSIISFNPSGNMTVSAIFESQSKIEN